MDVWEYLGIRAGPGQQQWLAGHRPARPPIRSGRREVLHLAMAVGRATTLDGRRMGMCKGRLHQISQRVGWRRCRPGGR